LLHELTRDGVSPLPSRSGIYRLLKRHNLIDPDARRMRSKKFKRWERGTAMELWQMGVVGGIDPAGRWDVVEGVDRDR